LFWRNIASRKAITEQKRGRKRHMKGHKIAANQAMLPLSYKPST
jgi:hypothetical protein